jgi:hypothetical protein
MGPRRLTITAPKRKTGSSLVKNRTSCADFSHSLTAFLSSVLLIFFILCRGDTVVFTTSLVVLNKTTALRLAIALNISWQPQPQRRGYAVRAIHRLICAKPLESVLRVGMHSVKSARRTQIFHHQWLLMPSKVPASNSHHPLKHYSTNSTRW